MARILYMTEVTRWFSERGLTIVRRDCDLSGLHKTTYHIDPDSGAKTMLAKGIATAFSEFGETMVWIDEWGIWPSAENWHLFNAFRESLGEPKVVLEETGDVFTRREGEDAPIWDRPGHLFLPDDLHEMTSLLSLVLYFVWGAIVVSSSAELILRISHDEWIDLYAKEGIESNRKVRGLMEMLDDPST